MATLVDRLRTPSAFFSSNWAGILFLLMGATAVPALAGVTRVVTGLDRHSDAGFVTVVRTVKATWRRDLPLSLALVVVVVMGAVNIAVVTTVDPSVRVPVVGFLVPVLWMAFTFIGAYSAVAGTQPLDASRTDVLVGVAQLVRRRPIPAVLLPVIQVLVAPILVFPPSTVAIGLSVPAWIITEWLGVRQPPLDDEPHLPDTGIPWSTA